MKSGSQVENDWYMIQQRESCTARTDGSEKVKDKMNLFIALCLKYLIS